MNTPKTQRLSVRTSLFRFVATLLWAGLTMAPLAGCQKEEKAAGPPSPPAVEVVDVAQKDVPILAEWVGTMDGTVNATIPKGTDPESLGLEQAVELLARREEKLREQGKDPRAKKARKRR